MSVDLFVNFMKICKIVSYRNEKKEDQAMKHFTNYLSITDSFAILILFVLYYDAENDM